ncbi:MAG: cytochrome c [Oscillatoriales cyanobacterium C42_A2020_001]|nr:cytochrome c [Leptolyngbyaceae cyanobacterium C42_A2020_001]
MENQVLNKENAVQWIVVVVATIFVVLLLLLFSIVTSQRVEPYARDVLSLSGNSLQGQAIFQMNCAGCHGVQADGRVGPSLLAVSSRKSKVSIIHQVTSGQTPPMPQFQPSPQEMADLLSYLETL